MAVLWRGRRGTFPSTSLCACADYASALGQGIDALPHLAVLKHLWPPAPLATPPHTTYAFRFDGRIVLAVPFVLDLQSSSSTARSGMDERRPCRAWAGRLLGHCVLHAGMGPGISTSSCDRTPLLTIGISPPVPAVTLRGVRVLGPEPYHRACTAEITRTFLVFAWSLLGIQKM
ncbi:hypothetical protein B0H13DRAFT_2006470, partial [Mycena leptocephala]